MKWLVTVAIVGAVVGAEVVAPGWIAGQAEQAVAEESDGAVGVEIRVSGPPVLVPVLATGRVSSWSVRLVEAAGREIPADVVVDLEGVSLDRGRLLRGNVYVTAVETASATVRLDLTGALPEPLRPFADRLAEVGAERLLEALGEDAGVVERDGELVVGGNVTLPVVSGSCSISASGLVVTADCLLRDVPPFLLAAFQRG